jgi:hypothetical protein
MYICLEKNIIFKSETPRGEKYFETKISPAFISKKGYITELKADFDLKKVWYELKPTRKTEIDEELEKIDKETGVNRILEDVINNTGIFSLMYGETKKIIERKKNLREERAKIVEETNSMIESEAEAGAENNTNEQ